MKIGICCARVMAVLAVVSAGSIFHASDGAWAAGEPATKPGDAADLYLQAAKAIVVDCPASSNMEYPGYPPMGEAWGRMEAEAWQKNGRARELARRARATDRATWPRAGPGPGNVGHLNEMRNLANDLGDAALFQHLQENDAEAIELIRDNLHLAEMLRRDGPSQWVATLVAVGIDALSMDRLMMVTSDVKLSADGGDSKALQVKEARRLIGELLNQQTAEEALKGIFGEKAPTEKEFSRQSRERLIETLNRGNSERTFGAMSLACHVFRMEKGRWPAGLGELSPGYLPRVPVDPWGNGTETFGYALIKGGLADGADRPLVYCRCESKDGMFFRLDEPEYGFYVGDGSNQPSNKRKQGGQFRDVASWAPKKGEKPAATTQRLP